MPTVKKRVKSEIDIQNLDSTQMLFYLIQRIDQKIDRIDDKIDNVKNKLSDRIDSVENKLSDRIDSVEDKLSDRIDNNFKWLVGIIITGFLTMLGSFFLR